MKRTLLFLIAMVAMVSAKATVVTTEQSFTETWGFTVTGSNNVEIVFNAQWAHYKLTQGSFSVEEFPSFKIYYEATQKDLQMKIGSASTTDGTCQYINLDNTNSGTEIVFNTETTFPSDKDVTTFLIQKPTNGTSTIRINKVVLLDADKNETILYNGIKDTWGYDALNYFGANIQFTYQYGNVKLPVAAFGEEGEQVTYTVKFRSAITNPIGFNYKYNGAADFLYDWPATAAGATEAVFTFKNTSARYLTNLELVEKSEPFAAWDVEIESIERTTTTLDDLEPKVLLNDAYTCSTYSTAGTPINPADAGLNTDCNIYVLVADAGLTGTNELRVSRNNNGFVDYPSDGYNFYPEKDENNIVKINLTKDFIDEVMSTEGSGLWHQISFWGNNIIIKGIATTKETLLNSVTTDAKGYATYSSNNTLALNNLPDGLEAYTAWLDGTTLRFNQKTAAVGSGTGLLIKGGANKTYYIPAKTDATEPDYNALSANLSSTLRKSDDTNYIFVMKKATSGYGSPEFKKLSTDGVTVPAKKAYVEVAASAFTSAHELSISFGNEDVTAINAVKVVTKADNRYYNLSGQVVANPTKGIYILNGKKVVIK